MKTFIDFAQEQPNNEGVMDWIKRRNQFYSHPEYGPAFRSLVQKHGGNDAAAEVELRRMASTPVGKYELKRMSLKQTPVDTEVPPEKMGFRASSTSGAQMFGDKPGSSVR